MPSHTLRDHLVVLDDQHLRHLLGSSPDRRQPMGCALVNEW
jgi:hypothetical protein